MMDWTDRHCRYFHRLLSRHARLYTEMLTTGAVIFGGPQSANDDDEIVKRYALSLGISGQREAALQLLDPLLPETAELCRQIRYASTATVALGYRREQIAHDGADALAHRRPGIIDQAANHPLIYRSYDI